MDNTFFTWDDFVENFGREMRIAGEVYDGMVENGLRDGSLLQFDFTFVSDEKAKLERLRDFILSHYPYSVESVQRTEKGWELSGKSDDVAVTADTLMFWTLDMAKRGFEFDAQFDAYGASVDATPRFPDVSESREVFWFDHAMDQYNAGNLSGALISWSHVIAINPGNVDAWYSRAIVKNELHTWKAALRDYDEAIRIAPRFITALINRGSLKADNGDQQGAISDYNTVIEHASDTDQKAMAYFNRGNSRLELSDRAGACADWKKARDLGADYASERTKEYCN
jgi:tetratricopeptide (TPR) repeat protein